MVVIPLPSATTSRLHLVFFVCFLLRPTTEHVRHHRAAALLLRRGPVDLAFSHPLHLLRGRLPSRRVAHARPSHAAVLVETLSRLRGRLVCRVGGRRSSSFLAWFDLIGLPRLPDRGVPSFSRCPPIRVVHHGK